MTPRSPASSDCPTWAGRSGRRASGPSWETSARTAAAGARRHDCSTWRSGSWGCARSTRGRSRRTRRPSAASSGWGFAMSAGYASATTSTGMRSTACCTTCWRTSIGSAPVTTEERLAILFRRRLHLEVPSLDTDLLETGLLDSLLIVDLLLHIERELGRTLPMETLELEDFRTLVTIARCIERKGSGRPAVDAHTEDRL